MPLRTLLKSISCGSSRLRPGLRRASPKLQRRRASSHQLEADILPRNSEEAHGQKAARSVCTRRVEHGGAHLQSRLPRRHHGHRSRCSQCLRRYEGRPHGRRDLPSRRGRDGRSADLQGNDSRGEHRANHCLSWRSARRRRHFHHSRVRDRGGLGRAPVLGEHCHHVDRRRARCPLHYYSPSHARRGSRPSFSRERRRIRDRQSRSRGTDRSEVPIRRNGPRRFLGVPQKQRGHPIHRGEREPTRDLRSIDDTDLAESDRLHRRFLVRRSVGVTDAYGRRFHRRDGDLSGAFCGRGDGMGSSSFHSHCS